MTVADSLRQLEWDDISLSLYAKTQADVMAALLHPAPGWQQFLALTSPAGEAYLPMMAEKARALTRQRFGNTVSMFVPLYLSNLCANECTYCGFTLSNKIKRVKLGAQQIAEEIRAIKAMGFDSLLLVTGEHETKAGMAYFEEVIPLIRPHFSHLAMEVQPLSTDEYQTLARLGVDSVLVYQETYHRAHYAEYHLRGQKQDFDWRLETPDRLGQAGISKIGLGALLGLSDWRTDSAFTARHLGLLQQTYWKSRYSVAFPRIKPCAGEPFTAKTEITDRQLIQLICAYRICFPEVELSLSTRESPAFRDHVVPLAINQLSAASQTQPGGYSEASNALEQFSTEDTRPATTVAAKLSEQGLEPVWTDWLEPFGR